MREPRDTRNYQQPSLARRGAFDGEGLPAKLTGSTAGKAFLADVLALAGEDLDAVREGVRVALASCEALFPVRESNDRRALEARAERHRPAGALSCPSAALRLLEIGKARFMPVSQWRPHRLCWFR